MALALIGNLASKLLPAAIGWGMQKLNNTNIGRGVAANANKIYYKTKNAMRSPTGKRIMGAIR